MDRHKYNRRESGNSEPWGGGGDFNNVAHRNRHELVAAVFGGNGTQLDPHLLRNLIPGFGLDDLGV